MKISLLVSDAELRAELAQGLARFGFDALGADVAPTSLVAREHCDLYVLDASQSPEEALAVVARLRATTSTGIVLLARPEQLETRIHGLLIGADAYLVEPVQVRELAAILMAVARRLRPHIDPPATAMLRNSLAQTVAMPPWKLTDEDAVLVSPDGMRFDLSHAERIMVAALADRPGETLSREFIGALLDQSTLHPNEDRSGPRPPQRVSMLVSRLRKKAARLGAYLPLRVVRGSGYTFLSPIVRTGPAAGVGQANDNIEKAEFAF